MKTRLTLLLLVSSLLLGSGCAQMCAQTKQDYQQELAQEQALTQGELSPSLATHFGFALSLDVISTLANKLLGVVLKEALAMTGALEIGQGKSLNFSVSGAPVDLRLQHDPNACAACFRLQGDLGGSFSVDLPVLGRQTVPLGGSFKFGAPILMISQPDGSALVQLDLKGLAESADSFLNVELKQLPSTWSNALRQPLAKKLKAHLISRLKPIELISFKPPELGIAGLRILPTQLSLIPDKNALFVGFTSNLPGVSVESSASSAQAVALQPGENLAIVVQPALLIHLASVLMQDGKIPRQYTSQGKADPNGSSFVTLKALELGSAAQRLNQQAVAGAKRNGFSSTLNAQAAQDTARQPLALAFRSWNLQGGPCFWFDALIAGAVKLENSQLEVFLDDIQLTNASVAPQLVQAAGSWLSAEFVQESRRLIKTSLMQPTLNIPGTKVAFTASSIGIDATSLTLRAKLKL